MIVVPQTHFLLGFSQLGLPPGMPRYFQHHSDWV